MVKQQFLECERIFKTRFLKNEKKACKKNNLCKNFAQRLEKYRFQEKQNPNGNFLCPPPQKKKKWVKKLLKSCNFRGKFLFLVVQK